MFTKIEVTYHYKRSATEAAEDMKRISETLSELVDFLAAGKPEAALHAEGLIPYSDQIIGEGGILVGRWTAE